MTNVFGSVCNKWETETKMGKGEGEKCTESKNMCYPDIHAYCCIKETTVTSNQVPESFNTIVTNISQC